MGLEYYRLKKTAETDASLEAGEVEALTRTRAVGTGAGSEAETAQLSDILGAVNQRFDFDFTDADKIAVDQWAADMMDDNGIMAQARSNTFETFSMANADTVMEKAFARNERNPKLLSKLLANAQAWDMVRDAVLRSVYRQAKQ